MDDQGTLDSNVTLVGDVVIGDVVIVDGVTGLKSSVVALSGHNAQVITADVLPLPVGAASEATLLDIEEDLDQFTFASNRLLVDGSQVTQPISAVSLPLPTGAATEITLASIDSKLNTLGQKTSAFSVPVVLSSDQSPIEVVLDNGNFTIGSVNQGLPAGVTQAWPVKFSDGVTFVDAADAVNDALRVNVVAGELGVLATSASGLTINGTVSAVQLGTWNVNIGNEPIEVLAYSASGVTINGLVTANIGTTGGLALDNTLTNGTTKVQITDGFSTAGVTDSNPLGNEEALIVRNIPSGIQQISGNVEVDNTVSIQAASISGVTVNGSLGRTWTLNPSTDGVTVSGSVEAIQSGTWDVNIGNEPLTVLAYSTSGLTVNGTIAATQSGPWTVSLVTESIEIGTVDQGSPTGLSNAWPVKITDGFSIPGITNASPVGNEEGLIVRNIPSGTQQVSGTVTTNQGGTWNVNVQALSASGLTVNGTVSVVQPLTVLASSASGLTINGSVSVANFPANQTVTVSGQPLTVQAATTTGLTVVFSSIPTVNVSQPVSVLAYSVSGITVNGTVTSKIEDTAGNSLTSTSGSLNVNITGGETSVEQHTVDSPGDTYSTGVTKGVLADARVVSSSPALTNGQFSALNLTTSGRLIVDGSQVTQPISATSLPLPTGAATEATLSDIETDLDQFTFVSTRLLVDGSGVTQPVSGNVSVQASATSGLTINGSVTVTQSSGSNLHVNVDNFPATQQVLASSASGLTVNISGTPTVNVNQPLTVLASSVSGVTINGSVSVSNFPSVQTVQALTAAGVTVNISNTPLTVLAFSTSGLTINGTVATNADTTIGGTVAPSKELLVAGKTNDGTPQYQPIPEGTGGRSVIVEGVAGGTAVPISGTVSITQPITVLAFAAAGVTTTISNTPSVKLEDGAGNNLTSQANGGQRALDVGIDVAGVQIDPRSIRTLTSTDVVSVQALSASGLTINGTVTANQGTANATPWNENIAQYGGTATTLGQKVMASSIPVVISSDQASGKDSSGNSTTTPLGIGGVFTGTYEDVSGFATIVFSVFADQASASSGFSVQWSGDGVSADVSEGSNVLASTGRAFSLTPRAKFFRIVYTNGAVAQTVFRLKTTYHFTGTGLISRLLKSSLDDDNYAQTVRSATNAKLPSGNYQAANMGQTTMANSVAVVLPSDQSPIQVVSVPGAVTGTKFYLVDTGLVSAAIGVSDLSTDNPILLVKNPSVSGKTLVIVIRIYGCSITNVACMFRLYVDPTITSNGTALSVNPGLVGNPTASIASAFKLPTTTSFGTLYDSYIISQNSVGSPIQENQVLQLPPGHNWLITAAPGSNSRLVDISLKWIEQ